MSLNYSTTYTLARELPIQFRQHNATAGLAIQHVESHYPLRNRAQRDQNPHHRHVRNISKVLFDPSW